MPITDNDIERQVDWLLSTGIPRIIAYAICGGAALYFSHGLIAWAARGFAT